MIERFVHLIGHKVYVAVDSRDSWDSDRSHLHRKSCEPMSSAISLFGFARILLSSPAAYLGPKARAEWRHLRTRSHLFPGESASITINRRERASRPSKLIHSTNSQHCQARLEAAKARARAAGTVPGASDCQAVHCSNSNQGYPESTATE